MHLEEIVSHAEGVSAPKTKQDLISELRTVEGQRKWYYRGIVWSGEMGAFSPHKFFNEFVAEYDSLQGDHLNLETKVSNLKVLLNLEYLPFATSEPSK